LEEIIVKFSSSHLKTIEKSICGIVHKNSNKKWSEEIVDIIKNIAMDCNNSFDSEIYSTRMEGEKAESFEELHINSYNCTKGVAAQAIGSLIWNDSEMFEKFKDSIDYLVNDVNLAVRRRTIEALHSAYNLDKEWVTERIIKLFDENHVNVGHPESGKFLFLIYPNYKEEILDAIIKCFNSEDKHLREMGSYYLTQMYFDHSEFQNVMEDFIKSSDDRGKWIIEMAVIYFGREKYIEKAKALLLSFVNNEIEHSYSRLFYKNVIDLKRDKDFLIELFKSNNGKKLISVFTKYLEQSAFSVIEYSELIILLIKSALLNRNVNKREPYYVDDKLSKLIFTLYDESSKSKKYDELTQQCLDLVDEMFEKKIGAVRSLSKELLDR